MELSQVSSQSSTEELCNIPDQIVDKFEFEGRSFLIKDPSGQFSYLGSEEIQKIEALGRVLISGSGKIAPFKGKKICCINAEGIHVQNEGASSHDIPVDSEAYLRATNHSSWQKDVLMYEKELERYRRNETIQYQELPSFLKEYIQCNRSLRQHTYKVRDIEGILLRYTKEKVLKIYEIFARTTTDKRTDSYQQRTQDWIGRFPCATAAINSSNDYLASYLKGTQVWAKIVGTLGADGLSIHEISPSTLHAIDLIHSPSLADEFAEVGLGPNAKQLEKAKHRCGANFLHKVTKTIDDLLEQQAALERRLAIAQESHSTIEDLEDQLSQQERRLKETSRVFEDQVSRLNEQITMERQEHDDLEQKQLQIIGGLRHTLKTERATSSHELEEQSKKLCKLEQDARTLKRENQVLVSQAHRQENELSANQEEINGLRHQIKSLANGNERLQREIRVISKKYDETKSELQLSVDEGDVYAKRNSELLAKRGSLKAKKDSLKTENSELRKILAGVLGISSDASLTQFEHARNKYEWQVQGVRIALESGANLHALDQYTKRCPSLNGLTYL